MSEVQIGPLLPEDYPELADLWRQTEHLSTQFLTVEQFRAYLARNPDISSAARVGGSLAGAVLGGHDGLRATIWRLAVDRGFRGGGIGRRLVQRTEQQLLAAGMQRAVIFIMKDNPARTFWEHLGWSITDRSFPMWKDLVTGGNLSSR